MENTWFDFTDGGVAKGETHFKGPGGSTVVEEASGQFTLVKVQKHKCKSISTRKNPLLKIRLLCRHS